jgi:hypothetical protein
MLPPYTYAAGRLAEEQAKDFLREGEHARLMRMARPVRRGPICKLLASVGRLLVRSGERLRERYEPARVRLRDSALYANR